MSEHNISSEPQFEAHPELTQGDVQEIITTFAPELVIGDDLKGVKNFEAASFEDRFDHKQQKLAARALTIAEVVNSPAYQRNKRLADDTASIEERYALSTAEYERKRRELHQ